MIKKLLFTIFAGLLLSGVLSKSIYAVEEHEVVVNEEQIGVQDIDVSAETEHAEVTHEIEEGHANPHEVPPFEVPSQTFLYIVAGIFVLAITHTFLVGKFTKMAHHYPEGSIMENMFHLLGEVEAVFLIWSGVLAVVITVMSSWGNSIAYIDNLNFTEPMFVFVVMIIAATKPIIDFADWMIRKVDEILPLGGSTGFLVTVLIVGPLLGSLITEPAAMTVTALILLRGFFSREVSMKFKYAAIATLFVNVSIGGALTNFAAPPVIIVASKWGWGLAHMFLNFGWKSAVAVIINSYTVAFMFKKELDMLPLLATSDARGKEAAEMKEVPVWVSLAHALFLAFIVLNAHHPTVFMAGFIFFLGFATVTQEYQESLKLRESLLVGGFLAGLITLGSLQKWWIQPVLQSLGAYPLFAGATALTSITDNAALTFLASQVEGLSELKRYMVVAGALAGGGLTVIANAPNPAGYSILNKSFGKDGINPIKLLLSAALPTIVGIICFLLLPSLG